MLVGKSIPYGTETELMYYTTVICVDCDESRKIEHSELERDGSYEHLEDLQSFLEKHSGHVIKSENGSYQQEVE